MTTKTGQRTAAVDAAAALASLKAVSPKSVPETLPWPEALDPAGKTAIYVIGDDLYSLDLAASRFERLTRTDAAESLPRVSPDGRRVAFVRANDLWVLDLATKAETRLTSDGSDTILNGTLSWVYWEEIFDRGDTGFWWSPDSSAIAFLRTDESRGRRLALHRLLARGSARHQAALSADGRREPDGPPRHRRRLRPEDAWMDSSEVPYEYVVGVDWLPDSRSVAVQTTNRAQTKLDVWRFDRATGKTALVLSESDPAFVYQKEIQFSDGGKTWIVTFESGGHTHLFRYGADGVRRNAVTQGPWSVRGPGSFYGAPQSSAFVDDAAGLVYFTSIEKSPLERHLYRIRPDGTGMARITREDGMHRAYPASPPPR